MRLFEKTPKVDNELLYKIYEEMAKGRISSGAEIHDLKAIFCDLNKTMKELAQKNTEFVEVIRHFFAFEKTLRLEEEKRKVEELDRAQPGLHDDKF